ncbi:alpha-tocopherol transfer protein-like [Contarinia nasturtii]|uniref:alpha-tocopherol transfer protein-like n=1 Tax=Contarinia nasturtii TaxID=265458 RepID=UPI0012D49111|nr:alpha-tocopherol transfer protein-like [Contarinia nasturtii]XP_031633048.1 alpha-tocopherol transfer protein-like [Contarinia nasturtii]XP_031633049.1 alpha-tocopherol transfer protein-like [Contarinia nasturtii]
MKKATTVVDNYEFRLSNELKLLAESELRETCATRDFALKAIRDWIESNPRIEAARMDASFLLRFLRAKKFSVPITQEGIERYLLLRQSYDFFTNLDMNLPTMKTLLNLGYIFAVPKRDQFGRRVIITRPGVFDPYKYANTDMLKLHGMVYETLMEDEENQIRGYVHIVDCTGVSLPYMTLFTPKEAVRIIKNAENTLPMRHKEIVAFKMHASIKFAADFALGLVTEKLRSRVKFFTSLESAKVIDRSILPLEYGGTIPMAEMIESWKVEMAAKQSILLDNDNMRVHLDMYSMKAREGAISALKQLNCASSDNDKGQLYGLQGSFRKLEVD